MQNPFSSRIAVAPRSALPMALPKQGRFSAELTNMIIDQVESQDLGACALTCFTWYQRSRYRIFRHVTMDGITRFEVLGALLRVPPVRDLAPLVNLIEVVDLVGYNDETADAGADNWKSNGSLEDQHLVFPFVRSFRMYLCPWIAFPFTTRNMFYVAFPNLRCLTVSNFDFDSVREIAELLSSFPRLEHLELENLGGFAEPDADDDFTVDRFWNSFVDDVDVHLPCIRAIVLAEIMSPALIHMFLACIRESKELQSVHIRYAYADKPLTAMATVKLLSTLSSTLESLEWCISPSSYEPLLGEFVHEFIDLSTHTQIKAISLGTRDDLSEEVGACLNRTLRSLNSSGLWRIELFLGECRPDGLLEFLDWKMMDDKFAKLPSLEGFIVGIDADDIDADVVQSVIRLIPKLQARGIVRLGVSQDIL